MLTQDNIDQIFEESEMRKRDPAAKAQGLSRVVFVIAVTRATVNSVPPTLRDGLFSAWAICLPFFPQPPNYTSLMKERRAEWFNNVPGRERDQRARRFFTREFLRLDLHGLAAIVANPEAETLIQRYLGTLSQDEYATEASEVAREDADA